MTQFMKILLGGVPFGSGNIGDEAILGCVVNIFQRNFPDVELAVATADGAGTAGLYNIRTLPPFGFDNSISMRKFRKALKEFDVFVWAGGTGLSDYPHIGAELLENAQKAGVKTIQLHTGGMCHLDADMTRQGLKELGTEDLDLVVLENVGNLVCPAEFDTGAVKNAMILSVPEGHDKPLKYPLIFQVCDALIINKIDVLPYFDFDMEKVVEYAKMRNPKLEIFPICAKTGEGVDAWCDWLSKNVKQWNQD